MFANKSELNLMLDGVLAAQLSPVSQGFVFIVAEGEFQPRNGTNIGIVEKMSC